MLKLVKYPNNFLKQQLPDFNFENPIIDPYVLEDQMIQLMYLENGIGLSANQVGIEARVFVIKPNNIHGYSESFAIFNPTVVQYSQSLTEDEEGCLSFPGLFFKVKRPSDIKVKFFDKNRIEHTLNLNGLDSRCFQHELDHLDGICFTDKISKLKLELAVKKQRKKNGRTK